MRVSDRQARERRERQFEALAAFANLGATPEDWRRFRLEWPDFFPTTDTGYSQPGFRTFTEWIYSFADEWARTIAGVDDPALRAKAQALKSLLLWYRDRLRAVWTRNDPYGINLSILLGFEREAQEIARNHSETQIDDVVRFLIAAGQPTNPDAQNIGGLPLGRPLVNGITGEIEWKFGCELQQSIYELVKKRWRMMVCPICGKFFVAAKRVRSYCSDKCSNKQKNSRSLNYYHSKGAARRRLRSAKLKTQQGRRGKR